MIGELSRLSAVRFVVFDFDGVFTDNRVLVDENGTESVFCSRADGLGLDRLLSAGVPALILSTETNRVVAMRAAKVRLECIYGCSDKATELLRQITARNYHPSQVAYVGNDVNDADCLKLVGVPICVADAHPDVKTLAVLTTSSHGGRGAVREVCDMVLAARTREQ